MLSYLLNDNSDNAEEMAPRRIAVNNQRTAISCAATGYPYQSQSFDVSMLLFQSSSASVHGSISGIGPWGVMRLGLMST